MKGHQMKPRLCVLGAGSWATALCKIFSESGLEVQWWFHRKEDADYFEENKQNPRYLTDVDFANRLISVYHDPVTALQNCDWVLIAIPSAFVGSVLESIPVDGFNGKKVISSIKGILPDQLLLVTDFLHQQFKNAKGKHGSNRRSMSC